ncbi:MAG TPA: urate hydroxylase PuuD, partial [Gaiellaceae bacterium]|nr:urate hydroxylase PuuD [Gaiellaceae bacterium]
MDPYLREVLDAALRVLHVVAGIAWIGASFYFIRLDLGLRPPRDRTAAGRGVVGEYWGVHGGGFYHSQKHQLAPAPLPEPLHWFKWEAYWTWISGFALLVVLYYLHADTYLIDPSVADLSEAAAVGISVGGLVLAWVVYDLLCRTVRSDLVLGVLIVGLTALAAWGAGELFSGRGAFIQVGAMLGTIMVASVLFVIIPAHWELIRAKQEERPPRVERGVEAKRRSVHNTYLALPVVLTMISNHFPFLYGHEHAWLVLVVLMLIGAWVRHFFVLRRRGRTVLAIPVTAAVATVALALAIEPDDPERSPSAAAVAPADALAIVE